MNIRLLKIFQGHIVAGGHIHVRHHRCESLPGQSSFPKRCWGTSLEGIDDVGAWTMDEIFLDEGSLGFESRVRIYTRDSWLKTGGGDLTSWGLVDLCFFSLPRLLGRSPKSTLDKIFFLFSPVGGRDWDLTPSSMTSLPLFSFIIAIPKRKDVNFQKKKKIYIYIYIYIQKINKNNSRLWVVILWARASAKCSGPKPQAARR